MPLPIMLKQLNRTDETIKLTEDGLNSVVDLGGKAKETTGITRTIITDAQE